MDEDRIGEQRTLTPPTSRSPAATATPAATGGPAVTAAPAAPLRCHRGTLLRWEAPSPRTAAGGPLRLCSDIVNGEAQLFNGQLASTVSSLQATLSGSINVTNGCCGTGLDYKIAKRIEQEGKSCVIVVNKWDTIPNKNQQTATYYEQDVREKLRILDWAPIVYSTAIAGHSVDKIIDAASEVEKERSRRLGTSILNQVVLEAVAFKPPPRTRAGKRGRVYYCTQEMLDYK
ncbi:hypothetical protein Ahy_A03g011250 isoform B [Arachis hypogaea]|uniref:GTPase Der C-terminal KH-domain-like domain-containing protein n=1 Tax=Arachis hypogaea TaxID=3818 RepID=A0A445DQ51_ARAHY|nr:hypothetical protein Ahy_A03g011250 isoform B [Arachis hypogaea]